MVMFNVLGRCVVIEYVFGQGGFGIVLFVKDVVIVELFVLKDIECG